ncbi:ribonuclease H2 subunit B [Colias croceus]|uniref:ribonuclease H2 subunit B n=1 Tax=Colias crocea TaxID=72248 RepID=UPI001E27B6BA|nr:ribonuclease H2 subunit B [Colias croceus]
MTRRSQKNSSPATGPITKRIENSWIMLIKDSLFKNNSFTIISLPHPAHGSLTRYCLDEENKKVYEIVTFNEPYRSWFIDETVKSDGSIMLVTPVNPLFLVLPRLRDQCNSRAVPLDDLLSEKGFDKLINFIGNVLDNVGDLKGSSEMKAYKYNEEKTLNWLKSRVLKLSTVLKEKNLHVTSGATSATFVASTLTNDSVDEEFYLKYAHGIISEYLQDDLVELLEKQFDFKAELIETIGKKRKSDASELIQSHKKIKSEPNEDMDVKPSDLSFNSSEIKKQKPLTAKEKARQKAASGTKTISAFFTKK